LAAALQKPARYIGMIGSRRKGLLIRRRLIEEGHASLEAMEKVVSPIGLDIGAQSVEEIAVSIVSQLIAVRRKGELEGGALNHVPSSLRSS
jgi:xanthine dehydrogenase accessory factor